MEKYLTCMNLVIFPNTAIRLVPCPAWELFPLTEWMNEIANGQIVRCARESCRSLCNQLFKRYNVIRSKHFPYFSHYVRFFTAHTHTTWHTHTLDFIAILFMLFKMQIVHISSVSTKTTCALAIMVFMWLFS